MECKSGGVSIKCKRTGKKIEATGMEHMRMEPTEIEHKRIEPTRMEHMRMQHITIKSKAVSKRTKPKGLCRRIKYIRKGKMVIRIRITYENIEYGNAK